MQSSTTKFSELGLADAFLKATAALGYENATPIQAAAIPVILQGRDLIGCAQTGTGKTAAFTLPMLDRLMQTIPKQEKAPSPPPAQPKQTYGKNRRRHSSKGLHPKPRPIRALVLSPTRELTAQIHESLVRYGKFTPLRQTVVFGGVSQFHQVKALKHGVDALVATPGRLLDLMDQGHIDLSQVEILVFDEADQMLDMGFLPALNRIVDVVPKQRQTLMFSATMPPEIRNLAQKWLSNPESIEVAAVSKPADRITQSVHLVDKNKKPDLLSRFLKETPRSRTLVFSRTKHGADKIVKRLQKDGLRAEAIHGNKSQGARTRALQQFKSKNPPVLVATDIAARGLDVNDVSHVVNFDLPETPETYVHRIGRTARAGAEGVAISFCAGDERGLLRQIERLIKVDIKVEKTVAGFEPTEPITNPSRSFGKKSGGYDGSRGGGGGYKGKSTGGYKGKSTGGKPKRYGAKSSTGSSTGSSSSGGTSSTGGTATAKPRRSKGSTAPPSNYKGKKPSGGATGGAPKQRRRRPTAG